MKFTYKILELFEFDSSSALLKIFFGVWLKFFKLIKIKQTNLNNTEFDLIRFVFIFKYVWYFSFPTTNFYYMSIAPMDKTNNLCSQQMATIIRELNAYKELWINFIYTDSVCTITIFFFLRKRDFITPAERRIQNTRQPS